MSFATECIQDNLSIWTDCLNSDFLRKLEAGTLDEACFKGYIVDDSLYLREYAKVFAWGMTIARDMDDIRACYSLLAFINESEGSTRLNYLENFGLRDETIQHLPQRPENKAYTDCMMEAARDGAGIAECMMACLPCMVSYAWIFTELLKRTPSVKDTLYWPLVRDYTGTQYESSCRRWIAYTDQLCVDLTPERQQRCKEIFRACSLHELRFWRMSELPRADLP